MTKPTAKTTAKTFGLAALKCEGSSVKHDKREGSFVSHGADVDGLTEDEKAIKKTIRAELAKLGAKKIVFMDAVEELYLKNEYAPAADLIQEKCRQATGHKPASYADFDNTQRVYCRICNAEL